MNSNFTSIGFFCSILQQKSRFLAVLIFSWCVCFVGVSQSHITGFSAVNSTNGLSNTAAKTSLRKESGSVSPDKGLKMVWKAKPFDHQVFIENKGQFDSDLKSKKRVLFQALVADNIKAYFFSNGVLFRRIQYVAKDDEKDDGGDAQKEDGDDPDVPHTAVVHLLKAVWSNANPNVTISAEGEQEYPYTYGTKQNKSISANLFKKITYHDIYPGIDIEYVFPGEDQSGLKYSVIVHPGADISVLKLKYSHVDNMHIDAQGNVVAHSDLSDFIDHTPVSSYQEGGEANIEYSLNDNVESFAAIGNYDKSKTLVIDPLWTTTLTGFSNGYNKGYDIDYDNAGNVYVGGGYDPYEIVKFNAATGTKAWTYQAFTSDNTTSYDQTVWGDFAVDKRTGTSYVGEGFNYTDGAWVEKVNTLGSKTAYWNGGGSATFREIWRMQFNPCNDSIAIGGGGTNPSNDDQVAVLDTTMTSLTPKNPLNMKGPGHDVCLMALDPIGSVCYMAVAQSSWYNNGTGYTGPDQRGIDNNYIFSCPLKGLGTTIMTPVSDAYTFSENNSVSYVGGGKGGANGMNGMAASPNYLYTYDGKTLNQRSKTTGATSVAQTVSVGGTSFNHGGLAADACDDVYVGVGSDLYTYNSSLTNTSKTVVGGTVYALTLGLNDNFLYATGNGFVEEFANPTPIATVTTTVTNASCSLSNGAATGSLSFSCAVTGSISYSWSPGGQTTATITGLAAGTYTCNMSYGCGAIYQATATITNTAPPTVTAGASAPTICSGSSATLTANGAVSYSWNTGATTSSISVNPTSTTTYTVTGTTSGCSGTPVTVVVTVNPNPSVTTSASPSATICQGSSTTLSASGASSYSWNTGQTTSSISVSPASSTTYSVTGTISGCSNTTPATVAVTVNPNPTVTTSASPSATICQGSSTTLSASGANTYSWNSGQTTSSITVSPAANTTYTVTGTTALGCSNIVPVTIAVTVNPSPSVVTSALPSATICQGSSTVLSASGANTYSWNSGQTTSSITVSPTTSTTYTVIGKSAAGCSNIIPATIAVTVNPSPTVTISASPATTICSGNPAILTATGGGTYLWSTGATTSTISVSPSSTTTYSVTVTTALGCDNSLSPATIVINVNTTPVVSVAALPATTICSGQTATLSASGASTYAWNDGETTSTISVSPTATTTYSVTGSISGCSNTSSPSTITIDVNPTPTVSVSASPSASICSGYVDTLSAVVSGGGTYAWSNGSTTSSIIVSPTITSTYSLVVNTVAGCSNASSPAVLTVTVNTTPTVTVSPSSAAVCSGTTAVLTATGASSYTWLPINATGSTLSINATATTTYTIIGSSGNCPDTINYTLTVTPTPTVGISSNLSTTDTLCPGKNVILNVTGGNSGTSYLWSNGVTSSTISISPTTDSVYSVIATNGACASAPASQPVNIYSALQSTAIGSMACIGKNASAAVNATGGKPGYTYSWSNGATTSTINVIPSSTAAYTCTVTDACGTKDTASAVVTAITAPAGNFIPNPKNLLGGQYVAFEDSVTGATQYSWTFGNGATSTAYDPYVQYLASGSYVVTLIASNGGCADTLSDTVYVSESIFVPNVFTPNGDGQNDVFHVTMTSMQQYSIEIYDRWGQRVFMTDSPNTDWDGRSTGGVMESDGTYYYLINATDYTGKNYKYHGYVQLIRGN